MSRARDDPTWYTGDMENTTLEVNKETYLALFDDVMANNARAPYVSRFDSNDYTYLVSGQTGLVVINHGEGRIEGGGLFNDGPSGAGLALLDFAITYYGVNYVECFAPLNSLYARLGFVVRTQDPFNWEYAPSNWHPSLRTPDYFTMTL